MNPVLRLLGTVLACALVLAPAACDTASKDKDEKQKKDKDDDDDDDDKGKKKKKKDTEEASDKGRSLTDGDTKGAVSGPSAGAVLDYMPADCPKGRVYLNTAALLSDTDAQKVLREITDKMLNKQREADAQKAVAVLKQSGFDLATGIREAAVCLPAGGSDPAIGVSLSVEDPLGLLQKLASSMGDKQLPITEKSGAKVLADDKVTFVQPAPHILVFGPGPLAEASIDKKGGSGFASARGQVGWAHLTVDNDGTMEAKITRAAANFNLWGSLKMAVLAKEDASKVEQEMKKKILEESAGFKGSPFALIDERLQNATLQAKGDTLVVTLSVPTGDVTTLLKAAAPQLGVQLSGDGGAAPPPSTATTGGEDPLDELLKMMRK